MSIPFPPISPEIASIEVAGVTLALRWYAVAYLVGLMAGWRVILRMLAVPRLWAGPAPMQPEQVERLLTWVILGVIAGGRLGFVLFYQPGYYLANPGHILRVWEGGMSFHGGFLGVVLAGLWFCRIERVAALSSFRADERSGGFPAGGEIEGLPEAEMDELNQQLGS